MMDVVNLIIGIVSGVFTVASVILAIYCWILSAIKDDEKQFSDNKEELIQTLYSNIKELKEAEQKVKEEEAKKQKDEESKKKSAEEKFKKQGYLTDEEYKEYEQLSKKKIKL